MVMNPCLTVFVIILVNTDGHMSVYGADNEQRLTGEHETKLTISLAMVCQTGEPLFEFL